MKKNKKESNGIFLLDDEENSIHPSSMSQSRLFSLPSDFLTGDSDDGVAVYWSCDLQIPSIDIHLPPQVGRVAYGNGVLAVVVGTRNILVPN